MQTYKTFNNKKIFLTYVLEKFQKLMTDGCHFTNDGYRLIANPVPQKISELDY